MAVTTSDKPDQEKVVLHDLSEQVQRLSDNIDKLRLAEYLDLLERPRRLLYINFLVGIARGFGSAIGFTILAAIVIYFMQKLVILNMPIIGSFIAHIVQIVQSELNVGGLILQSPVKI
jgi:hypothetical protein